MSLRILSLNVWGGKLHASLIQYLVEANADVLCLQEVVRSSETTSDWLLYRDRDVELPQRANLFDEIRAALPDHDGYFCPSSRGELHDGNRMVHAEFGLATFVRKSLPVIGQALDFVHGAFSPDGWGKHPRPRNAHCLRIFDYGGGYSITIAQMHGLRAENGKGDTPERHAQADTLVQLIGRVWPGNERLIVCGDLNLLPDSDTFTVLGNLGLADLVTGRGHADTRTSYYGKPGRFADYMLATPDVEVVGFDVVAHPEVSDHRALLLDLR